MSSQSVKLIPIEANGSNPFRWQLTHGTQQGDGTPGKPHPKLTLGPNSGPHLIKFTIEGSNNYKFSGDPIWIQRGSDKPKTSGVDSQIAVAPQLYNNGKTLAIVDWNTWAGDLTYQLNIDNAPTNVDPVITNGGGGGSPPPPPPPPPMRPGDLSTNTADTAAPTSGALSSFDGPSFVIGLVIGLVLTMAWFKWGK